MVIYPTEMKRHRRRRVRRRWWTVTSEKVEQVSLHHKLSDDEVGHGVSADGEERDEVAVSEPLQHLRLQYELPLVQGV